MEVFILVALIFVNGLFVMSEIALVSARKSRLEHQAEKGDLKARKALDLANNPEKFLSAAQIGITLIAILTGVYSGERFSRHLQPSIEKIDFLQPYAATVSTTIIVIIVTFLSIIFGELIPKQIGLLRAERISKLVAGPVNVFAVITHPIVWLLNKISKLFFRIFNIKRSKDDAITEEEIKTLIERVFHLSDRNITSLMTHRSDIVWFNLDDNEEKIKEKILAEPHSVYPICEGNIDEIKGFVSIKDLYITPDHRLFKDIMQPALFIPENNTPYQVLEKFKESQNHSCFIVDEYGSVLGLVTLNDILEAIVGDIPQPDVEDYEIIKRDDGTYLVDGQIPFYDFLTRFEKTEWMHEGEHDFDTIAGFILHELEKIPKPGDKLDWKGFKLEVLDMDGHRIDKILVDLSQELKDEIEE